MKVLSKAVGFPCKFHQFFAFFQRWFFGLKFDSRVSGVAFRTVKNCAAFTYPAGLLYFVTKNLELVCALRANLHSARFSNLPIQLRLVCLDRLKSKSV